jgi:hypothetical protein
VIRAHEPQNVQDAQVAQPGHYFSELAWSPSSPDMLGC